MNLIQFSVSDYIATVTLNRVEKKNALTGEMIQYLLQTIKTLSSEKSVRILMLNANGKDFCAGADIAEMQTMSNASPDINYRDAQALADLLYELYHFPKPTIAIAQGVVRGGGIGLIAACDIAIAAPDTTFAFSETSIGLTPSTISPYVIAAIGERATHYYFLTGEVFDAAVAKSLQLIQKIILLEDFNKEITVLCKKLIQNSPQALKSAKALIKHVSHEKITPALSQITAEHLSEIRQTTDAKKGLKAFLEKCQPSWSE